VRNSLKGIIGAAAVLAIAPAAHARASSNVCLNGFVWREAFPGDAVCVTPPTRDQAAADNAAAASRVDPSGPFGPNSCRSPFVWRAARPSDLVCVTVDTRAQTAADNAAAASRRDSLRMSLSRWTSPNTVTCSANVCTLVNDSTTSHVVSVTNINVGTASLMLYRTSDRRLLRKWSTQSVPRAGVPGGRAVFRTNQIVCSGSKNNAYFRVKDPSSGLTSDRVFITTGCHPL
jgi:hypothetical protein